MELNKKIYVSLAGFVGPIALVIILNLGIIYGLPNYLNIFVPLTDDFYSIITNPPFIEILVGIATIFVLFFGFVQFTYNVRHLPPSYMWDYILFNPLTLFFISFFLSELVIVAFFSYYEEVHKLNFLVALFIILISIVLTTYYFFWLIKSLDIKGMVKCISSTINLRKIDKFDKKISKNRTLVNELATKNNVEMGKGNIFILNEDTCLRTKREGILVNINLTKLLNLLEEQQLLIKSIQILPNVGDDIFPYRYLLNLELNDKNDIPKVQSFIHDNYENLEKCFEIESNIFDNLFKPFSDLLVVYDHIASETPYRLKELNPLLRDVFINHFFNKE